VWIFLDVNWGSSTQAQTYKTALTSVHKLVNVNEHVKNYRPQILVLTGKPQDRPPLVDLANLITKNNALMVCGHVVQVNWFSRLHFAMRRIRLLIPGGHFAIWYHTLRPVAHTHIECEGPFLNWKFSLAFKCYYLYLNNYDTIYLTALGLTPGGSSTVHIYTQTIHRTTQFTN